MQNPTLRLALLAATLGAALCAHALTLTYAVLPASPFHQTHTDVPAFDPSLGTLTAVRLLADAYGAIPALGKVPGIHFIEGATSSVLVSSSASSSSYFRHFYFGEGPLVDLGEDAFHDTGSVGLPLEWGLHGLTATWALSRYTLSGKYQVQLTYIPQAVPEPSALAALGLGSLVVLRRRKRA